MIGSDSSDSELYQRVFGAVNVGDGSEPSGEGRRHSPNNSESGSYISGSVDSEDSFLQDMDEDPAEERALRAEKDAEFQAPWVAQALARVLAKTGGGDVSSSSDHADALMPPTKNAARPHSLPPGELQLTPYPNLTASETPLRRVLSIVIHPSAKLALVVAQDMRVRLYQIDNRTNPLQQSLLPASVRPSAASFLHDGTSVLITGDQNRYYLFDLATATQVPRKLTNIHHDYVWRMCTAVLGPPGSSVCFFTQYGAQRHQDVSGRAPARSEFPREKTQSDVVYCLDLEANEIVHRLKCQFRYPGMLATYLSPDRASDGSALHYLVVASYTGPYILVAPFTVSPALEFREPVLWHDKGATMVSCMAACANVPLLAVGQESGVVNIYNITELVALAATSRTSTAKPLRSILTLVSRIHVLAFNPSGEVLFMSDGTDSRFVHVMSGTVFDIKKNVQSVCACTFSPDSRFVYLALARGDILALHLPFYDGKDRG